MHLTSSLRFMLVWVAREDRLILCCVFLLEVTRCLVLFLCSSRSRERGCQWVAGESRCWSGSVNLRTRHDFSNLLVLRELKFNFHPCCLKLFKMMVLVLVTIQPSSHRAKWKGNSSASPLMHEAGGFRPVGFWVLILLIQCKTFQETSTLLCLFVCFV